MLIADCQFFKSIDKLRRKKGPNCKFQNNVLFSKSQINLMEMKYCLYVVLPKLSECYQNYPKLKRKIRSPPGFSKKHINYVILQTSGKTANDRIMPP